MQTSSGALKNLSGKLQEARVRRGWSKARTARELGVSRLTYRAWEDGFWTPSEQNWPKVAGFIGASGEQMFTWVLRRSGLLGDGEELQVRQVQHEQQQATVQTDDQPVHEHREIALNGKREVARRW